MVRSKARRGRPERFKGIPLRKCGKIRYTSFKAAVAACELQGAKHEHDMRAYKCSGCNGYHLTTKP